LWQRRGQQRRGQRPAFPSSFSVVQPGTTKLRLLVVEAEAGQATVWGWAEIPSPGSQAGGDWLVDACAKALSRAEEMAQDLAKRWLLPDQMLVGLPGSRLVGKAWPVVQRRARPDRPVEERELRALLERALRLAVNRLLDTASGESGWLLVDSTPVALSIDGRGVTDPVGFRAAEMGAVVFAALTQESTISTWRRVAEEMDFRELTLVGTPTALAASFPQTQSLLVDVGGESTDIIWSRAGRPAALHSVPYGGSVLTRLLARQWRLAPDRAERLKRAYVAGHLAQEASETVQGALLPGIQKWLAQVEDGLALLSVDEVLPSNISLLGGGSTTPEMVESVRALAWSRRLTFERHPEVHSLRPTDVPAVVNRTELGRGLGDVAPLSLAAWVARQQQPLDRPALLLRQLCYGN
jgi:hypothetical protein